MTCSNAPAEHRDVVDCFDGLTPWGGAGRVPCGWCWTAAGYDALQIRQVQALVAWRGALEELLAPAQLTLDGDLERGRAFDRLCDRVRQTGVGDGTRSVWLKWCQEREVSA